MRPVTPELRKYLLELVREERSLEQLYRVSHSEGELRSIRAEWKAAYRAVRESVVAEDARIRLMRPLVQSAGLLRVLSVTPR